MLRAVSSFRSLRPRVSTCSARLSYDVTKAARAKNKPTKSPKQEANATVPLLSHNEEHQVPLQYPILASFLLLGAVSFEYVYSHLGGWEGLKRCVSFYSVALPKYAEYRYHQWMDSPQAVWDELDERTSKLALEKMLELKAFYIKSGQMVSSNIGNAFPEIWIETLSPLQDQCPSKPFEVVKEIVESEMKRPLSEVFATFQTEPIGAASIGQVHRAKLRRDGREVVVKIMYPEVERYFRGDVRTIKAFCKLAQPVHVPALEEVEKQFMTEFDYVKEAQQLNQVRENLLKAGLAGEDMSALCVVPEPVLGLCTKRVLVMEELKGDKLVVALRKDLERHAKRAGLSVEEFLSQQQSAVETADDAEGPTAEEFERYRTLVSAKRSAVGVWNTIFNMTLGLLPGIRNRVSEIEALPINIAKLVDDLIYIHGYEILSDGYFNGDPHPGNIILLGVEEGLPKLGLIDYGQTKKLSEKMRLLMCRMVVALAEDNRNDIILIMKEAGYKSRDMDEENIYLYAKVSYDEDTMELTGGKHIQLFMEDLQGRDPIDELPKDWLMVSRTSVMLRGLAHALKQSRSVAQLWKPIALKELEKAEIASTTADA